jgi:monoamine oxidase
MKRRHLLTGAAASLALAACGGRGRVRRGAEQRVVVIGAGLAGLVAGWELDHAGHDVTIVEARDRPGGRIETLREAFADGLYAEAGAAFISDTHTLVRRYCRLLELPVRRVTTRGAGEVYHVGGRRIVPADPKGVWPMALTPEERRLGLSGMWKKYVESAFDTLKDDYDKMTTAQFLRTRGASAGAVTLLGLGYLELAGDGVGSYSALAMLRDLAHRRAEKETLAIPGGNDRLPRALAAWLGERMRYRSPVIRIEPGERTLTVVVRDGATPGRIEADRVVCAIPGSVL